MNEKKRLVFINPDYHNAFLLAEELSIIGWKTTIALSDKFPDALLFSTKAIMRIETINKASKYKAFISMIKRIRVVVILLLKNDFFVFYGKLPNLLNYRSFFPFLKKISFESNFDLFLYSIKALRKKIVYVPSGCLDEFLQVDFSKIEKGNICNNCGFWDRCNDKENSLNFSKVRRYSDLNIGNGAYYSNQFVQTSIPYRSLDLNRWHPNLNQNEPKKIEKSEKILILHSFFNSERNYLNRNIKGTPMIIDAVNKLKSNGISVQLNILNDIPINQMINYQSEADIIVDELIYGWHGSTTIEALALGKPTVCYLRQDWLSNFSQTFPHLPEVPVVNANSENLYDILLKLCTDDELRVEIGKRSRVFAEMHFDVKKNAEVFNRILSEL